MYLLRFQQAFLIGLSSVVYTSRGIYLLDQQGFVPVHREVMAADIVRCQHHPEHNHGVIRFNAVASVMQMAPRNFYHWLTQCMARLLFLLPLLDRQEGGPITLVVPDKAFVRQTLIALSVDLARVHFRAPSGLPTVYADTLYTVDWRGWGGTAADACTEMLTPRAGLVRIRHAFARMPLGLPPAADTRPVVVYASRTFAGKSNWKRRVENEVELVAAIKDVLAPSGMALEVFHGFNTPLVEAAALFRRSRVVIGIHGGSLANLAFCAKGSSVVEIALPELQYRMYMHMSMALGLHYHMINHFAENMFHSVLSVDINEVRIAVQATLVEQDMDSQQ
jgi:hypothetical protein